MKVQQLLSELTVYFDGAHPAGSAPLYGGAEDLGKHFNFNEVGPFVKPDGAPVWLAKQGRHDEHRIHLAYGSEGELSVQVDNTKGKRDAESARQALDALWSYLWMLSEGGVAPKLEDVGNIVDGTLAIVEVERAFDEIVPSARHMREAAVEHLGKAIVDSQTSSNLAFRFSVDINLTVGHRTMLRKLTVEPKTTARSNVHVLFTQSPLPFEKHLAMVRKIVSGGKLASA